MIFEVRKQPAFDVRNKTDHVVVMEAGKMFSLIPNVERRLFTDFIYQDM